MFEKSGTLLLKNKISFVLPIALSDTGRDEKDHQRMMLLLESMEAFFNLDDLDRFFIVCPRENITLLADLLANRIAKLKIEIIDENSLCPEFMSDPDTTAQWPKPNKGWYRQQLIKLAIYERMRTDFYMTLDADVIFCRDFGIEDLIMDGKAHLNIQREQDYISLYKSKWQKQEVDIRIRRYRDAEKILQYTRKAEYIDQWYGETPVLMSSILVSELASYLEKLWQKPWREVLLKKLPWNEYPLYFLFIESRQQRDSVYIAGNMNSMLRLESCLWLPKDAYLNNNNIDSWEKICAQHKNKEGIAVVVQSWLDYPLKQVADIARVAFGIH